MRSGKVDMFGEGKEGLRSREEEGFTMERVPYSKLKKGLPGGKGQHVSAYETPEGDIVFYQALSLELAEAAVRDKGFSGDEFDPDRVRWAKTGFGWVMNRSDCATAEGQERIVAVRMPKEEYLKLAREGARAGHSGGSVIGQWDPDYEPVKGSLKGQRNRSRKTLHLGIRPKRFQKDVEPNITGVDDVTPMVEEYREEVMKGGADLHDRLMVPNERKFSLFKRSKK
ncbi:DUF4291 family protein [Patescibacteria group bacterium]|nr:DUF4291 family protein [Patescibacteria group bacterium]